MGGNTARVSRLKYEMHRDRRSPTSRHTAFVVVQPAALISFWVCRGENHGSAVQADAMHGERGRRALIEMPKWSGSVLSSARAECTNATKSYGRRAKRCTVYRARPPQTPRHPLACSTAHGLSAGMYITGGWRQRIIRARPIPADVLPAFGRRSGNQDRQEWPSTLHVKRVPISQIS